MSEQTNPIISFKNFSFQYRAQKKPTLHDINPVSYTHLTLPTIA